MLRIILWRLGSEFWHIVAFFVARFPFLNRINPEITYFAFGANLSPTVLLNRQITPLDQRDFILTDHELRFNQPGPYEGFGFASVHAAAGKQTFGRLIKMHKIDEIRMDYFEVVPVLRRHRKIWLTENEERFFFYQATHPVDGLQPTEEYYGKIMQAVEQSTIIPEDLLAEMRAIEPLKELIPLGDNRLFLVDVDRWPALIRPLAPKYDRLCRLTMMWMFQHQLFQRWI